MRLRSHGIGRIFERLTNLTEHFVHTGPFSISLCSHYRGGPRGRVQGVRTPPPELTCGFLIQLVFCKKKETMWFIGVEVEQETSAPPPKKKILDPPLH